MSEQASSDYNDRFGGLSRLYGRDASRRLRESHVCVVGLGGVGSWAVEALARTGVGALTLVDQDDVCITNVNRQLHALDGQLGRPKAEVLAERVRLIAPECRVTVVAQFFTERTAEAILATGFDGLVDAIDSNPNKALLLSLCVKRGIACVTVGGAGGRRDPTQIYAGDLSETRSDQLLRILKKRLRRDFGFPKGENVPFGVRCIYSPEKPVFPWADGICRAEAEPGSSLRLDCEAGFGSAVFVTAAFGLAASAEIVRLLTQQPAPEPQTVG
jgi:tRNA A37 threonylcarbamoyladenosine dehydratase